MTRPDNDADALNQSNCKNVIENPFTLGSGRVAQQYSKFQVNSPFVFLTWLSCDCCGTHTGGCPCSGSWTDWTAPYGITPPLPSPKPHNRLQKCWAFRHLLDYLRTKLKEYAVDQISPSPQSMLINLCGSMTILWPTLWRGEGERGGGNLGVGRPKIRKKPLSVPTVLQPIVIVMGPRIVGAVLTWKDVPVAVLGGIELRRSVRKQHRVVLLLLVQLLQGNDARSSTWPLDARDCWTHAQARDCWAHAQARDCWTRAQARGCWAQNGEPVHPTSFPGPTTTQKGPGNEVAHSSWGSCGKRPSIFFLCFRDTARACACRA